MLDESGHRERLSADIPGRYCGIDHIAIAVRDLETAITFYVEVMEFALIRRHHVRGATTGMMSAEMEHAGIRFVLCQGTEPESQVARLVDAYGPGVAHIALAVDDVSETMTMLQSRGLSFDTGLIKGAGLEQTFSTRCSNSGLCFEFIKRDADRAGFDDDNIQSLFSQLERSERF